MSIYLGANELQNLNIGNTRINEVYLGAQKIWPKEVVIPPPNYAKSGFAGQSGSAWGVGNPIDPLSLDEDINTKGTTATGVAQGGAYTRHPDPQNLLPQGAYVMCTELELLGGFYKYSFESNEGDYSLRSRMYGGNAADNGATPNTSYLATSAYRVINRDDRFAKYMPMSLGVNSYNLDPAVTDRFRQGANFVRMETTVGGVQTTNYLVANEIILNMGWGSVFPPTVMEYELTVGRGRQNIQPGTSWSFTEYGFMSGNPTGPGANGFLEATVPGSIVAPDNLPLRAPDNQNLLTYAVVAEIKCLWGTAGSTNAYLMVHIWNDGALGILSQGYPYQIEINGRTLTSTNSFSDASINGNSQSIQYRTYRETVWSGSQTQWTVPWPELFAANAKIPVKITRLPI